MNSDSYRSCGICCNDYGEKLDDGSSVIPMHLSCCQNHLCFGCAEKYRAEEISKLSGRRKKIGCHHCKKMFHSEHDTPWTIGRAHIALLGIDDLDTSAVRDVSSSFTRSNTRSLENNDNAPMVTRTRHSQSMASKEQEVTECNPGNSTQLSSTLLPPIPSEDQELVLSSESTNGLVPTNLAHLLSGYDSDDESRLSTGANFEDKEVVRDHSASGGGQKLSSTLLLSSPIDGQEPSTSESTNGRVPQSTGISQRESNDNSFLPVATMAINRWSRNQEPNETFASVSTGARTRASVCIDIEDTRDQKRTKMQSLSDNMKLTVTVNGGKYSAETINELEANENDENLSEDAKEWRGLVSRSESVFRVRVFQTSSTNRDDMFGRKCSFWCIKNECMVTTSFVLSVLPKDIQNDGKASRDYIRGKSYEEFNDICKGCAPYYSVHQLLYARTYKYFIEMKPGDIIALQISGKIKGAKNGPIPALVFGVVQDDDLILKKKDDASDFPYWNFKKEGDKSGFDPGLMLRRVKWYREGVLCDVRGDDQAKWLAEHAPKWMAKVGAGTTAHLKEAMKRMRSNTFIQNTIRIEKDWVEVGLTGK